jgi:VanZ family protein
MILNRPLRIIPVIVYVLLIFFVSSRPNLTVPGPDIEAKDKIAHFVEYLIFGFLLFKGIGWSASRHRFANFLFLFLVGSSVAVLDEVFQSYIPGRAMSIFDWIADALGVGSGIGLMVFLTSDKERHAALEGKQPREG